MQIPNRNYARCLLAASSVALLASFASAQEYDITTDTFVDSGSPGTINPATGQTNDPGTIVDGQDIYSYGADGKVKAVTSSYSSSYPYVSATHVLFDLPASFWTAIGTSDVASAIVSYYPLNDSLSVPDNHNNLELHPLLQAFTEGNGTQSPLVPSTDGGATWDSYDGAVADAWTTPGGTYDTTNYVLASVTNTTLPVSKGSVPFSWDITSLINNPTTRAELENYGALIKVVNEGIFPNNPPPPGGENDFVSFYSSKYMTASDTATSNPQYIPNVMVTLPSQWVSTGGGDWNTATNWSNGIPNTPGAEADLFGAITASSTLSTSVPITVSTLHFNSPNSYLIDGSGSLTLQTLAASLAPALVQVDRSSNELDLPMTLASNTTFAPAAGANLTIAAPLTVNSGLSVTQTGSGTVKYESDVTLQSSASLAIANSSAGGALSLAANAKVVLPVSTSTSYAVQFNSISLAAGADIDLTQNALIVNYGTGADPFSSIQSDLITGYNSGAWNGPGIISSAAALNSAYAVGYADGNVDSSTAAGPGQVLLKYTLVGDANLDGTVNLTDLLALLNNYGQSNKDWAAGDFNYDGTVNLTDLLALLNNYGQTATLASAAGTSSVPEPGAISLLAIGAMALVPRRRQSRG